MTAFTPTHRTLSGTFLLEGAIDQVFPLFSPLGERAWVPGWNPELLHPPGTEWQQGMIFRTQEELGPAVWIVTRLDRKSHEVEYHRVEAERWVARIAVRCGAQGSGQVEVSVSYAFVGLTARGNQEIGAMREDEYERKLDCWRGWIQARGN